MRPWTEPTGQSQTGLIEYVTQPSSIVTMMAISATSSPLPSPAVLADYARIDPVLPAKFTDQFVAQGAHRMQLEDLVTRGSERRQNLGQLLTFTLAISGLGLAALCGIFGNPIVGSILAIVSVGGPMAAFVLARVFNGKSA